MDIYSLNLLIIAAFAVGVFLIWVAFYPTNLNFLMERIDTGSGYTAENVMEDTRYALLKALLPLSQKLSAKNANKVKKEVLADLDKKLTLAGDPLNIKPIELYNMRFVGCIVFAVIGAIFGIVLDWGPILAPVVGVIGFVLPVQIINGIIKSRAQQCDGQMPDILDLIAVCMQSGMTLPKSMEIVCDKNKGVVVDELKIVLSDTNRGASLTQAFVSMGNRLQSKRLKKMIQSVKLSERLGTPIANQLKILSETIRQDTFEQVKQAAARAATFVLFPVLFFILPALAIIVAGPVAIGLMNQ